ncbi:MAG: glycosyltransferase [Candidatus Omnitrophica bacterium]|nr:glycosyltransferase [Candidatus Omnitrophota bacterium]MDD5238064.1 glycosyltransferase [Candidatus Omnitrophota bacterium]
MKIIITYVCAGAGHFRAAQALYNYIKEKCPALEVELVDALQKSGSLFRNSYILSYSILVRYFPLLWRLAFWITYTKPLRPLTRRIASCFNIINMRGFSRYLVEENADVIISTHFLASELVAFLKGKQKIKSRLFTVITDFSVHPFWICKATDKYIVASEFTKEELLLEGIEAGSIEAFGIPVDTKFSKEYDKKILCEKLGINKDKFSVLVMTGSFGVGPLEEIVHALYKDIQVLVICASNKKLYTRLKQENLPNVKIFGFIDNVEELMAVCDMIITKPGGVSISEILNMDLPPIFISAIPGQETGNLEVLKKYGVGISYCSIGEIKNAVLDFRDHRDRLDIVIANIRRVKKPYATKEICNVVCQGSPRAAG